MVFVTEAALIALREGLEALLITGILLGLVSRLGRPDARKHVWAGFALAAATSVAAGWAIQRYVLDAFEEQGGGEWFELVAALAAVAVLTYMVVWMWKHTRELMTTVRGQVEGLLTRGALLGIVFLTFASVIREGLEVVLFYGALATRATPFDLAWSGLVGFAASAIIVFAILRGSAKVDLQKFFAITGVLLVFVAAGLLVHSVSAATALDLLEPAPMIWDTSGVLTDDSAVGRVLHAIVGYTATPTLLQALLYFGYVFGVGGWYLASLGAFHSRAAGARRLASDRVIAAGTVLMLVAYAVGMGAAHPGAIVDGHSHGEDEDIAPLALPADARFGVLLRSHGEPVHYNETTYRSFADFIEGLLVMLGMENLLLVDQGTVLLDKSAPFARCDPLDLDAQLMDAWTHDHAGPALCVASPDAQNAPVPLLDGYSLAPGPGPGLGEPDILEMAGLSAYVEWLQMENQSPMHETKGRVLDAAERQLQGRYGDRVVVARSYHILPHVGGPESDAEAAELFRDAGVEVVVDAYTSAVFSDVMNTCMMLPHMEHAFGEAGYAGDMVHAAPSGLTHGYAHAVAAEIAARLAEVPADEPVAVFLTHHGQDPASTSPCGGGADQYHANAAALYDATLKALAEEDSRENVRYFQVYGGGADAPDDGILSPMEAVAAAKEAGIRTVLDLPYELTGNGFDNLVVQRQSYGLAPEDAPHYDANHETRVEVDGVQVRILSSAYGAEARGAALVEVVEAALAQYFETGHGDDGAHADDGHQR